MARRRTAVLANHTAEVAIADVADGGDGDALMSLEKLAEQSGLPARTIRYYQAEKLLDRPERDKEDGRVARYGTAHLERLRLIGELRDRGLKLPAIRTLLNEGDASTNVADWLGLDATLRGSWGHDGPKMLSRDELAGLLTGTPPGTQGAFEDAGFLMRQGDVWLTKRPGLLEVTAQLVRDGVPVDLVLEAGNIMERQFAKAAKQLIDLFVAARRNGFGEGLETATLMEALRPIAGDAARLIFAHQLEREIDALLADTKRLGRR